jgi:hypothetical protein
MKNTVGIGTKLWPGSERTMDPAPLRLCVLALACAALAGCGGGTHRVSSCPASDGVVLLAWTVRGQAVTAAGACRDIDHLVVELGTACGDVEIEPIPCASGVRWRYDELPEGNATAALYAVDARDAVIASAVGVVTLTPAVPDTPTVIDLQ